MRDVTVWLAIVADDLPRPPGVEREDTNISALVVIAVVVVVLAGVVLIAWLLKPLVVRRLAAEQRADTPPEPAEEESLSDLADAWIGSRRGQEIVADETLAPREQVEEERTVETIAEPPPAEPPALPPIPAHDLETETVVGVTLTVRELLDHANAGQLLRGFALYSEAFLARFRADTGLSDEEFAATFGSVTPAPPEARAELAAVSEVELLPDGRVRALIAYTDGGSAPPPERFTFVRAATGDRWLIDDIATVE